MIDYWKLSKDFQAGDVVQWIDYARGALSPYAGRVVAVQPGLGTLDVQWPVGQERVTADEVVKVDPKLFAYLPPGLSTDTTVRKASERNVLALYRDLAKAWKAGVGEVAAWDKVYRATGKDARIAVDKVYGLSSRLFTAMLKRAAYWYGENRSYRVSQAEINEGAPRCPKCRTVMKRTTYKMEEGKRVKLFACPKDLFLLKMDSLIGPDGEPVQW